MNKKNIDTATLHSIFLQCNQKITTDTRKIVAGGIFFALKGDNFNGNSFAIEAVNAGAAYCVVDENINTNDERILYVDDVLKELQNLATFHRQHLNIPVIAITGSNGKTTTKELFYAVLSQKYNTLATKGNLNNHIGVPLTLLSIMPQHQMAIVEMGANHQLEIEQLCRIALPDYGMITNVGKAHLEGFGGFAGVIKGKTEMYTHIKNTRGVIFCNAKNEHLYPLIKDYEKLITYLGEASTINAEYYDEGVFLAVEWSKKGESNHNHIRSHLTGAYNFENIAAAITIGDYFEVAAQKINDAIVNYIPDNQRSQVITMPGNINIILDAYNANPTSMYHAIMNFDKKFVTNKVALLGDMYELGADEDAEHLKIIELIAQLNIQQTVLVGKRFAKHKNKLAAHYFDTIANACAFLKTQHFANHNILIKGSRSSQMDKAVNAIVA
ncbi:MAG TPA: UDP-N-acetylmuramoyl-tripeptide--D-alanyl-D-alanine ligase [Bacteroidia bacterium]|nr:UDP-N-acetylmuramoyl-tripeptide--D-alanyl-D-alanine ligase [Bacteroidia bacterium]